MKQYFTILLTVLLTFFSTTNCLPRIINGNVAILGQFPWQAALIFENEEATKFWFCSGSIINESWILTAAHCIENTEKRASSVIVYTGTIDISDPISDPASAFQNLNTNDSSQLFITHENFNKHTLANDIALIKLQKHLKFDETTNKISLCEQPVRTGSNVIISGWGKTGAHDISISPILTFVNLVTIPNKECQEAYGSGSEILPTMMCAATNQDPLLQSPCQGDSGGPLIIDFDTEPKQVAVASFVSDTGCDSGMPSGFTRTEQYLDWIKTNIY